MRRLAIRGLARACAGLALLAALPASANAAAGDLDRSFGEDGIVTTDVSEGDRGGARAVALQPDGKIVAAGDADSTYGGFQYDFALARYLPDGSLDPTFGDGGVVRTDFPGFEAWAHALALQPDGKIVAGGDLLPDDSGDPWRFALARYLPDGSLDPTFGDGGIVIATVGPDRTALADIALLGDGKILVAGTNESRDAFLLARYTPSGALDNGFGHGGIVTSVIGRYSYASALTLAGSKAVVAGSSQGRRLGRSFFTLARYLRDGSLDRRFGRRGVARARFRGFESASASAIARQSDGKLVAAGYAEKRDAEGISHPRLALARFRRNGRLDRSFSGDGQKTTRIGRSSSASSIVTQRSGKLIAAGGAWTLPDRAPGTAFALARYRPGGRLDRSFGGDGIVTTRIGQWNWTDDIAVSPGPRLVAAGGVCMASAPDCHAEVFALARYRLR